MTFQALAMIGAAPAAAAPFTCTFAGGVLTVTSSVTEDIFFQREATTGRILLDTVDPDAADTTLAKCPGAAADATVTNTTQINVVGNDTLQDVIILMYSTTGVTTNYGTVNWTISLGGNTGGDDTLTIDNSGGDNEMEVTLGASGIDLNTDADLDVTVSGVEETWIFGGPDDDTIWGSGDATTGGPYAGKMVVDGGDGDDTVAGGAGNDCLADTGAGAVDEDLVDYSAATSSVIASLATGIVTAGGLGVDTLVGTAAPDCETFTGEDGDGNSFEDLVGSGFNDTLTGDLSAFGNIITPGAGDDAVSGAPTTGDAGIDYVDYSDSAAGVTVDFSAGTATGNGNDTLSRIEGAFGSEFDDTFVDDIESDNPVFGDAGNDTFDQGTDPDSGDGDSDALDGEGGTDTVDYSARTDDLVVTLNSNIDAGTSTTDGPCGGDGTAGSGDPTDPDCADGDIDDGETDDLQGIENANLGSGDDTFTGSAFNNVVNPGGGQNVLDGEGGSDTLDYSAYEAGVEVNMAGGSTAGDSATDFENARGSKFADTITGDDQSNRVAGRGGNDNIRGGGGDDTLRGGGGKDRVRGGTGDDDLFGAKGNDRLLGGKGDDFGKGGPGKDVCKGVEVKKSCGTAKNPKAPVALAAKLI